MPKSVGASLHPCLTPLLYSRDWVSSPSTISLACTSVYSFLMILINFGGQPSFEGWWKETRDWQCRTPWQNLRRLQSWSLRGRADASVLNEGVAMYSLSCLSVGTLYSWYWAGICMYNLYVQASTLLWKFSLWYFFRYGTLTATGDTWIPLTGVASAKWCPPILFQQH